MHRLGTEIEIAATAERIWSVLMDFSGSVRWSPVVPSIAGLPTVGETLSVFIQSHGSGGMRFRPNVLAVERQCEFRRTGKLVIPGLFDGEHFLVLKSQSDARVVFHQGEVFSGVLVPLVKPSLDRPTRQGLLR
jgi:hypothetical protein